MEGEREGRKVPTDTTPQVNTGWHHAWPGKPVSTTSQNTTMGTNPHPAILPHNSNCYEERPNILL